MQKWRISISLNETYLHISEWKDIPLDYIAQKADNFFKQEKAYILWEIKRLIVSFLEVLKCGEF